METVYLTYILFIDSVIKQLCLRFDFRFTEDFSLFNCLWFCVSDNNLCWFKVTCFRCTRLITKKSKGGCETKPPLKSSEPTQW